MTIHDLTILFDTVRQWVWSVPMIAMMVGVGVYFTILLRGVQFRFLGRAFSLIFHRSGDPDTGDLSPFQALMTAVAGAVGTGNIAGVATAVSLGGFGALFWMWVVAFFGMATTYSESLLGVEFRKKLPSGFVAGGPMYVLRDGAGQRFWSIWFAVFGALAAFGIGTTVQANSVADALQSHFAIDPFLTGVVMTVLGGIVILGGVRSIGRVTGVFVPVMAGLYLIGGLTVLIVNIKVLPSAFALIIRSAFTGQAAVGGFMGASILAAVQMGVSRGIFSNESGLGSLSVAASTAQTDHSVRQGLVGMTGTFLTTMVVCTITGLALAVTGVLGTQGADGEMITGAPLAMMAFDSAFTGGRLLVLVCLVFFAYSTVLAWGYYGEKCMEFLFGPRVCMWYRIVYVATILPGALLPLSLVWSYADATNGLMAIPNLISLILLAPRVKAHTDEHLYEDDPELELVVT